MTNESITYAVHSLTRSIDAHVYTSNHDDGSIKTLAVVILPKPGVDCTVSAYSIQRITKDILNNNNVDKVLVHDNDITFTLRNDVENIQIDYDSILDPRSISMQNNISLRKITATLIAIDAQQKGQHVAGKYAYAAEALGIPSEAPNIVQRQIAHVKKLICNPDTRMFVVSLAPSYINIYQMVINILRLHINNINSES